MKKLTKISIIPALILISSLLTKVAYADIGPRYDKYSQQPTCDNTGFIIIVVAGNVIFLAVVFAVFAIIKIRKQNTKKK